jgi:hypothetical protein
METAQIKNTTIDKLLCMVDEEYIHYGREKIKQLRFDMKPNINYEHLILTSAIERIVKTKCDLKDKTLEVFKKHLR